jgi:hypothetical protein
MQFEQRHLWDMDPDGAEGDEAADDAGAAGQELADFLINLKQIGRLSAKDVCMISYYGKLSGLTGPAAEFSFRPDAPTGHYNRHLNTVMRFNEVLSDSYAMEVPAYNKYDLERTTICMPCLAPHESFADEVASKPGLVDRLRTGRANGEYADAFMQHEVVQNAPPGADVWPLCLYLDGIPMHKRDGVLAFYVYNMVSETRHLVIALRWH